VKCGRFKEQQGLARCTHDGYGHMAG